MILRNSLTKKHEEFVPKNKDLVTIYSCGPTVYDNLHIGNLSSFIYADVLRRSLTVNGFTVKHTMNITDVDDKTILNSSIEYAQVEPYAALSSLTAKYKKVFLEDVEKVGNDMKSIDFISAVDTIPEMISFVQRLLDNKIAYIAEDAVYFSITKYYQSGGTYGVLQQIATQQSQPRIANDEYDKASASDFALWKKAQPDEPSWEATFTEDLMPTTMDGRPGWHIECSAMIEKVFRQLPIDIHTGGIDLKFPHHENEIAQSVAGGASSLATYFVHNNHILVDGKKMSKSLKNFYTLRDVEDKGFSASAFRLMILESHYHSESNFSWEILEAAQNRLKKWQSIADLRWQMKSDAESNSLKPKIVTALADNINTPRVLKEIDFYFDDIQSKAASPNISELEFIQESIGINLLQADINDAVKQKIANRENARNDNNWELSDSLRAEILELGFSVRDLGKQQIWSRV